jgi:hypothetical protein
LPAHVKQLRQKAALAIVASGGPFPRLVRLLHVVRVGPLSGVVRGLFFAHNSSSGCNIETAQTFQPRNESSMILIGVEFQYA